LDESSLVTVHHYGYFAPQPGLIPLRNPALDVLSEGFFLLDEHQAQDCHGYAAQFGKQGDADTPILV
jgi:hypothetical protein